MKVFLVAALLCSVLIAAQGYSLGNSTTDAVVFKADFSKSTLSAAFGGSSVSYGNNNVILWASGGGIDVNYPKGSYVPSGPIVGGFGIWTNHKVPTDTAVFKYSVFFPSGFQFVKGGNKNSTIS